VICFSREIVICEVHGILANVLSLRIGRRPLEMSSEDYSFQAGLHTSNKVDRFFSIGPRWVN